MKTVRIKVTQKNIDDGVPAEAFKCPIAIAFEDAGLSEVGVTRNYYAIRMPIYFGYYKTYKEFLFKMPPLMADWINTYDKGKKVLPIEFTANIDCKNSYNEEYN